MAEKQPKPSKNLPPLPKRSLYAEEKARNANKTPGPMRAMTAGNNKGKRKGGRGQ